MFHRGAHKKEKNPSSQDLPVLSTSPRHLLTPNFLCQRGKSLTIEGFASLPTMTNFATQFAVSVVMHLQGLCSLQHFDGTPYTVIFALAGAGLEGIFLTSLVYLLLSKRNFWGRMSALQLSVTSVTILIGDLCFMQRTGGERADMWVLASGAKEARFLIKAELSHNAREFVWFIISSIVTACPAAFFVYRKLSARKKDLEQAFKGINSRKQNQNQSPLFFFLIFAGMTSLYMMNAWMPVFHSYASFCGRTFIFSPPGTGISDGMNLRSPVKNNQNSDLPNVILVMHESLSGEVMMADDSIVSSKKKSMPFFQQMLHSDVEYFVFENARTVAGDTADAMSAIQTGCLPLNHRQGREVALNTTIATEFKRKGFETVSISSRLLNLEGTKWFMVQNQLSSNFDQVFHPGNTDETL
eukprot:scaffold2037_cov247-Chaetoceros_neogracile.AAC.1